MNENTELTWKIVIIYLATLIFIVFDYSEGAICGISLSEVYAGAFQDGVTFRAIHPKLYPPKEYIVQLFNYSYGWGFDKYRFFHHSLTPREVNERYRYWCKTYSKIGHSDCSDKSWKNYFTYPGCM